MVVGPITTIAMGAVIVFFGGFITLGNRKVGVPMIFVGLAVIIVSAATLILS